MIFILLVMCNDYACLYFNLHASNDVSLRYCIILYTDSKKIRKTGRDSSSHFGEFLWIQWFYSLTWYKNVLYVSRQQCRIFPFAKVLCHNLEKKTWVNLAVCLNQQWTTIPISWSTWTDCTCPFASISMLPMGLLLVLFRTRSLVSHWTIYLRFLVWNLDAKLWFPFGSSSYVWMTKCREKETLYTNYEVAISKSSSRRISNFLCHLSVSLACV